MTIMEAIKSGKKFKRPSWVSWFADYELRDTHLDHYDILAEDYVLEDANTQAILSLLDTLAQKDAEMSSLRSEVSSLRSENQCLREELENVQYWRRGGCPYHVNKDYELLLEQVDEVRDGAKEALTKADAIRSGVKE